SRQESRSRRLFGARQLRRRHSRVGGRNGSFEGRSRKSGVGVLRRVNAAQPAMINRRTFLTGIAAHAVRSQLRRVVVVMCDGFGLDYLAASVMPTLARWKEHGLFKAVRGVMPAVTNANNASICCGTWPAVHGITGNSYWEARSQREEYMESASLLRAPTLFERAARFGVTSALLSSKKKTVSLLPRGAAVALTAEAP